MAKKRKASGFEGGSSVTFDGLVTAGIALALLLFVGIADAARQAWMTYYVQPNR